MKRYFCVLLVLILTVLYLPCPTSMAEEEEARLIHVVYDDSGSMYRYDFYDDTTGAYSYTEYYDKWCRARYAMEVFAGMMEPQDRMSIYCMSQKGRRTMEIQGSESPQERIDRVHQMADGASGTYYETVTAAYEDLMAADGYPEKWLVILTDGDFEGSGDQEWKPASELDADFAKFAESGVQIIYLAIGEEVREMPVSDEASGIITRHASDSEQILEAVTAVCNTIYKRQELPTSYVSYTGNALTLDFDVPMEQLYLLCQGTNVSLSGEDPEIFRRESEGVVRYREGIPSKYADERNKIPVATDLTGTLVEFSSANPEVPIPAGSYTMKLTGASAVDVYYKPAVELGVSVQQNGNEIPDGGQLIPGEFAVELFLRNPLTGERIESEIFAEAEFSGTIENGGQTVPWDGTAYTGTADEGPLQINASVTLPGSYGYSSSFTGEVSPPLGPLWIEGTPTYTDPIPFGGLDGNKDVPPFEIRYAFFKEDPETGEKIPLTEAELATLEVTAKQGVSENPGELPLDTYRNADGVWVTDPSYRMDEEGEPQPWETLWGDVTITVQGQFTAEDGQKGAGELEILLTLTAPPWYLLYFWQIFWLILLILLLLFLYFAFVRPAKFVRGRQGMSPAMSATLKPDSLRPVKEADPIQTSGIHYGPKWVPFHNQKATVRVGCYGETHLHFTVEAARVPHGGRAMRLIGLQEQLESPLLSNVKVNGRELSQVNFQKIYGYHLQIQYRIGSGRKATDYDFKL